MQTRKQFLITAASAAGALATAAWAPRLNAQGKPPIKIGHIAIMTGPASSYGKLQEVVMKIAVEDINAKGGINGSQVVLQTEDSQLDPGQAVLLFRKLLNEGAFGVIGPMTGTQWETVSPIANQLKMPAITVNASKPGITVRPWTLRLGPADDTAIPQGFAAFLKKYPGIKRVAIVADVREASGKAGAEIFEALARKNGLQVAEVIEFSTRATDLSPVAIKVRALNPDAVFAVALTPSGILLAKEFAAQGYRKPVLGNSIIWPGSFVNNVGEAGANWHTIGFSTNDESNGDNALYKSVVQRYVDRIKDPALGIPANMANNNIAYDAMLLLADILRRNGVDGTTPPARAREIIMKEFTQLKTFRGLNSYQIRDTGDGDIPHRILTPDVARKVWKFAD